LSISLTKKKSGILPLFLILLKRVYQAYPIATPKETAVELTETAKSSELPVTNPKPANTSNTKCSPKIH
jgi:hypothetical protein